MKLCGGCGIEKDEKEFYSKYSKCLQCEREKGKKYYWEHREECLKRNKEWARANPDKCKAQSMKRRKKKIVDEYLLLGLRKCIKCGEIKGLDNFYKKKEYYSHMCKKCFCEHTGEWRHSHLDLNKIYQKRYRDSHPEKVEELRIRAKARTRKRYPDREKERSKKYYIQHKDERLAYAKEYRKSHPEVSASHRRNRRAQMFVLGGYISTKECKEIVEFYGNKCLCCGRDDIKITMDHIVPLALGGTHMIDNVQPLCGPCNGHKGIKTADYRKEIYYGDARRD